MADRHLSDLQLCADARKSKTSIDFLRDLPFLERLSLTAIGLRDVTPLYDLPNLQVLTLNGITPKIDFPRFTKLQHLMCSWNARAFSRLLHCVTLKQLGLDNFTGADFHAFAALKALENIGFAYTRLESLAGIERLQKLRRLSLGPANRLETLEHLEACSGLRELDIEAAKKLSRLDPLSHLRKLENICFNTCPNLESLLPLKSLPELQLFALLGTTSVADGDLSVLLTWPKLKHASIRDQKHYNHKNSEFPKAYRPSNKLITLHKE